MARSRDPWCEGSAFKWTRREFHASRFDTRGLIARALRRLRNARDETRTRPCRTAFRQRCLASLRGARLRVRPRMVEARLAAGHRGHHFRDRAGAPCRRASQSTAGARAARMAPRALERVLRIRRVRAFRDREPRAVGPAPTTAFARGP